MKGRARDGGLPLCFEKLGQPRGCSQFRLPPVVPVIHSLLASTSSSTRYSTMEIPPTVGGGGIVNPEPLRVPVNSRRLPCLLIAVSKTSKIP